MRKSTGSPAIISSLRRFGEAGKLFVALCALYSENMPQLERRIVETLMRPDYKPVTAVVLARDLNVTKKRMQEFRDVVEQLSAAGKVRETADGLLRPQAAAGLVQGTIKKTAAGAGFLIPHKTAPGYKPA